MLSTTHLSAQDYYWVNGSGAWSDYAGHWAKVPNPTGITDYYTNVPGSGNDVYFGFNGGVAYTVNVDAGSTVPKCRKMDWSAVPMGTVWGGSGSRIDIYGSAILSGDMSISFSGETHFTAFGTMNTILSNTVHFPNTLVFEGTIGGGWTLGDPFFADYFMYHYGGQLITNGKMVTIGVGGQFQGFSPGKLDLGNSDVIVNGGGAAFFYAPLDFNSGTSNIIANANCFIHGTYAAYGNTTTSHFYNVTFNNTSGGNFAYGSVDGTLRFKGFATLHGYGGTSAPVLNNAIFEDGALIYNAFDYNNITLTAGKTYTIQNYYGTTGTDQTILPGGSITAAGAGTCSEFIRIKSWQYGTHFNLVNNSGVNQTVHCVILEDCHATGTNTLTVNDGLDLGNTTGWLFVNPHGMMDLYWVGGDGDWDDPCHWTSNPAATVGDCNCVPNGATNVHFTANSGFTLNPSDIEWVSTPADASFIAFRDMDWSTVTGNPTFHSVYNVNKTSEQYIYGSLTYSPNMVQDFTGTTRFRGKDVHTLTSAGQTFKELVFFEGVGEISLQDAFSFTNGAPYYSDVYHLRGTIKTLGNTISLATNNSWQGNKDLNGGFVDQGAVLWLGEVGGNSSTVTLGGNAEFFAGYEAGKFHPVHSHIKGFPGGGTVTVTAENRPHDFWDVSFFGNSTGVFYGGITHKLTYDGCYANIANSSPNRLIHELEMKDDGEINGNQTFDILTLTGGNGYVLQNGSVQTITSGGSFNTTSDCEHYVTLTSGIPDKTSEIKKEGGGMLTINNVVLDNITADLSTGASYLAVNGVALGITTGWSINVPSARSLYWVGGNGDWSDAAHWSTTSGGAGGACPPTPLDNVFFNGVSGLNASNFVTISQLYAHCKDMDWTGVGNGTKMTGYTYLNIFGNFKLSTGVHYEIWFTYFRANQPATITTAGNKYYYTFFWNPDGDWTLTDDFETIQDVDVYHYYGTLRTNNHNIGVGRIWWGATPYFTVPGYTFSPTAKLFLGSSKIRIYPTSVWAAEFLVSYPVNNFHAGTSEIIFESGVYSTLYSPSSSPLTFYDVTYKEKDGSIGDAIILGKLLFEKNGTIYASNDIHEVEFKDNAMFYGARNYHIMKFAPGKRYTFLAGYTQTIVPSAGQEGQFIAQGLPGQYIEMKSTDFNTPAIIHKDDYDGTSTCTKYLFLTGMTHTGTEDIYVPTPGGNVFNNTGWQFFPCNPCPATIPVLDPASITVGCPPGQAKLMLANLKPDEWAIWYSDPAATMNIVYNGGQPGPMGNMFMPTITGPATYYARVYSDGGLCESTVILTVNITTTTPPMVFNLFGGGALCTYSNFVVGVDGSQIGVQYQLLFNGNPTGSPLVGTGNAITFPYQGLPGTYTVQAFIPGTACSVLMNGSITPTYSPDLAPLLSMNAPGWVCEATSITVYENFGEAVSWAWTGPAGFSSTLQYPPPILNVGFANAGTYSLVVTGANGCTNAGSLDIAVIPKLQASLNVTPITCQGAQDGAIAVSVSGGIPPYSFNWIIGGQTTQAISNLGPGFYVVQVFDSTGLCESTLSVNLTDPPLTDVQATPDISLCAGAQSPGVLFSSQTPGVNFSWTNNNTSIGLGASGNGNIPAFTAMNSSGSPNIALIVVTPSLNGCVGTPDTFRITVNAMPTVADPADQVVCNGSNTALVDFVGTPSNVGFIWTNDNPGVGLPASGAGDIASFTAINTGNITQTATISVTPTIPGFAYIPNTGTNDVSVVNTLTNTVVATIPVQNYPIGVSATPDGSKVYVTNTFSNTVSVINTATNTVVATVPVGDYPHGLRVSPDGSKVYVANEGFPAPSYTISVINTATNVVDATITVDYSPASFRFSPDGSKLYVANRYADNFSVINTATNTVITTVSGGDYPYVMGALPDGTQLYIANLLSNDVSVVNTATNSITTTIPVGDHPVGLDVSPDGSKVYVSNYNANTVSVINTATNTVVATVPVGANPHGVNVSLDGSRIYVAQNGSSGSLTAIDAATNTVVGTIPVGSAPRALGNFLIGTPCAGTPQTFTIKVNPTPTVTASPDQVVCNNSQTTAVNFSGAVSGTVFNWTNNNPAIGLASTGTGNIPAFTAQNPGTTPLVATIIVTPQFTANGITCTGTTDTFKITVNPTPTVADPADQSVCAGQSTAAVNFSGTIPGTVFNWTNNTTSIGLAASGTGNISAFTAINTGNAPVTATITVTPFYTNAGVTCSGSSQMFTISVNPSLTVTASPDQIVCKNSQTTAVNFSGAVSGTVFNWTNNNPSIGLSSTGTGNIPAFTAQNPGTTPLVATIIVTPQFTANGITCAGTTDTFKITVNPTPTVADPVDQSVCADQSTAAVNFSGTIPGTVFNWTNNTTSIGLAASGTGNISAFTAINTGNAPVTATITVTPFYTNAGVTCSGSSQMFTISVNPSPTVNQPANQVVCHNAFTADINFTGTTGAVYRWTNNTPSIGLAANGVGNIPAFTATNTGTAPLVATITVAPEYTANGLTCLGTPKTFTITVNPKPYVDGVLNQSYCNGATTNPIVFVGTVPGTVFNWINFNTAIGLGASGTGNILPFTATNTGTSPISAQIKVQAFYTNGGLTCAGNDTSFQIRVNPTPTVNQPANQVICNANLTSAITFTGAATLYRWTNNTPSIGLAANGVGDIAAFTATNTGNAPLVATITVTPEYTANGITCLGAAKTFTITVNPTPNVADPADQVVCAGQLTAAVNFSGTVTGTVYTWTNNNTAIGLGASGTGNIAAFTAINAGNTPVTATITVTSSYTNAGVTCSGSSQTFTITVNSLPAAFNITGQTSYCSPGDPGAPLGLSGSQIGVNYQLWQGASPVGAPVAGTGAALNFGYFPAGTYTVVATQAAGGCSRTMTGSVAVQAFNCTVTVTDPCVCKNNATNLVNGQFDEFIKVNAPSWQNWTVKNIFGLYNLNSAAPPAAPIPVPVGTTLAGIGNNMFLLNGLHVDAIGYSVTVSNGFTDLSLPLTKCFYPDPVILDPGGPYCLYSPNLTLSAKVANNPAPNPGNLPYFTVNGTNYPAAFNAATGNWETTYDITALGNYTVGFSFDAGMSGPNNPNDPGCVQAAEPVIFNVIATPASLSCNDLVYVSLDADCSTKILPDMILEGTYNCYDDYQVNIFNATGQLIGNIVTADLIGQTLVVKIKHLPSGNICWGNLIVQDKIAPDITCKNITIPCIVTDYSPTHLSQLGLAGAYPTVTDCSNYTLSFVDIWHNLTCDSNSAYLVRTWTAKDTWGNSSTCNQYIYFRRVYLPEVKFPADVTLSCENANTTPQNTGTPYIDAFGLHLPLFPEVGYCEFSITYQDLSIPVCDGTHKILRHWTLLDWCLPTVPNINPLNYIQLIKVLDTQGPNITCPTDLTVSTDPNNCCATVNLPDALVKDGCSRTNNISAMVTTFEPYTGEQTGMYSVGGALTNFPGNNFWDLDTLGNWGITPCLPIGNHVVMYTAQDDCGNTSTCSFHLTVRDLVPPIAVCDQYTVAAVTNDDPNDCYMPSNTCSGAGVAWVTAKTFDDGSVDNCSNLHLTVRRMAPYSDCITQLNDCEKVTATAEKDSIKFYCCETGSTQTVILRAYQVDVNGNPILDANGDPIFNECMVNVEVQDKVKPVCQAPNNTTVSCENFDPTLWGYGLPKFEDNCCLDTTKTYQNHCGLTHSANYTLFDTICNKGTITRTFKVWDCHGQTNQCVQRVVVQYEQDYYVKFPNDVVVNTCKGSGNYGVPVFFGKDCEQLGVAYEDHIITLVPEACYRIERTWHVVNLCTYNPNLPYTYIPNPRPNNAVLNPANLPGPIVSAPGTLAPWAPTVVKINPTDAVATNYSTFWSANVNGYEYKQQIYINDTEAPALNCPASPVAFCDLTPNDPGLWNETYWWDNNLGQHDLCEGPVDLSITTTDSCSGPNVNVWYRLYLDLDGDGQAETLVNSASTLTFGTIQFGNLNGPGTPRVFDSRPVAANQKWGFAIEQQVTGSQKTARVRWNTAQSTTQYVMPELPYGTHKIEWTVSDGCGNEQQCAYDFTVKDCKKPTVVCLNGLSVNIMPTQMVQLWASDFLKYTEDNCTPSNQLKIGIRKSGTGSGFPLDANGNPVTSVVFTCDELGTQLVEIWSMDKAGNADFCETYVLVQDNNHNCPTVTGAKVAGKLATEASDGVASGGVEIAGSSNAVPSFNFATMTDNAGAYNFNAIPLASNSTLTPNKDDNPLNGVSTYDLVLISKHILGIEPLNSPYKMIAADANKSGSITTFDIVEIRKLILGIYSELPYNTSWRFVDKDFVFPNPANPFETLFSENKLIQNLNSDRPAEDFISVKVGDVNGTAIANSLMSTDDRTAGTLLFDVNDQAVRAGATFTVALTPTQASQGYQFTLNTNGLEVVDVAGLKAENYAVFKDAVTFSVDGPAAQSVITLRLKATKNGKISEMISISSRITKAEGYGISNNEQGISNIERSPRLDIGLRFKQDAGTKVSGVGFELYQNQPNPFVDKTVIEFHLPAATAATLTIYDETGRTVFTQNGNFAKGYNTITIDRALLNTTGVLYYKLETATDSATKKMIQSR